MNTMFRRVLLVAAVALAACSSAQVASPVPNDTKPPWTRSAVIYEVNVRQFTPEGTFAALEAHLPRLKRLGVDILWLMPIQPIGKVNRKGGLGSYYSISDYTAINPEFGNEADFKRFVDAAHRQGLKVILDWVANHSAFDHAWVTSNRSFYASRADGTISYARDNEGRETDWTDVAELNYDDRRLWTAMINEMRWWLTEMKLDGFRADVAGGVPPAFWKDVRDSLKATRPDVFMLAESEDPALHAWFDASYGWELHHILNEIAKGKKPVSELDAYFTRQDARFGADDYRMYFTSNHDENSWQGTEFERMGANHLPAFVLSATVRNSLPLIYTGQEASLNKRLRFFDKDTVDWNGPSLEPFYKAMFELKHSQPVLRNGAAGGRQTRLATNGGDRVYAFSRVLGDNAIVVMVNFGEMASNVTYSALPKPGAYTDWFTKSKVTLGQTGEVLIPAHGYRVLVRGK